MFMKHIFSGIQPSGNLHIGNYLGAIKQWVEMQNSGDCIFCVVDLHAITVPQDPKELRERTLQTIAMYLACGIDPKKNILFVQSHVSEHAELAWILNTLARMSELKLMHQYKEKSMGKEENISMGLFDYPVLMAADILLYQADSVPVGDDQLQHVELARELARRFNSRFGDTFVVPQGVAQKVGARIMALDDPTKKMSKSATSNLGYITLLDSPDIIKKKIQRAVTDSGSEILMQKNKPALSNLLTIYHLFSGIPIMEIEKMHHGLGYGEFKKNLSKVIIDFLSPIQEKYEHIMHNRSELDRILEDGAKRARKRAQKIYLEVRKKMGLL